MNVIEHHTKQLISLRRKAMERLGMGRSIGIESQRKCSAGVGLLLFLILAEGVRHVCRLNGVRACPRS